MNTDAERQREFRKRRREEGLHEVRGIWKPKSKHAAIKRAAKLICAADEPTTNEEKLI